MHFLVDLLLHLFPEQGVVVSFQEEVIAAADVDLEIPFIDLLVGPLDCL